MTVQSPPAWIQASSHPAENMRRTVIGAGLNTAGVVGAGDLAVTQNGTPNMSVNVAGGRCYIAGTEATYQGTYAAENRGTTNLAIAASDPTNPRIDLVVAKVQDQAYSGATNSWSLAVVTGTPAASPSAPSAPNNSIVLARVAVAAAATTIVNANITDYRTRATGLSGKTVCTSSTRPSSPYTGQECFETDTTKTMQYNGSTWICIARLSGRDTWTPQIDQSVTTNIAKTIVLAEYEIINNVCEAWFILNITGAGTAGFGVTVSLPVASAGTTFRNVGAGLVYDASIGTVDIVSLQTSSLGVVSFASSRGAGDWGQTPNIAVANGDIVRGHVRYPVT